jgi:hypothetical protein
MSPWLRAALASLYRSAGLPVPAHLLPVAGNTHRRYEREREDG